ncbi:hypothetical protein DEU56DRAFT_788215 [Suillus clintonianus]|uniref:uncharacterized protein n=1 Tax=Suillus clintonianus TaxID=1904413 RepID=UPI001B87116B|nr:uncharacterized protein DEU56DRAFT_788215 [Suillus clintonianus]KAG2145821.1 hypothetical protein DEU56DRAFT_788215 [Suillus clintonianus]
MVALQFLRAFSSDSRSTPGIIALARLGHRIDPALFENSLELWQEIALHLDLTDVLALGMVSELCRQAASMVLHYPHVSAHCLVGCCPSATSNGILTDHARGVLIANAAWTAWRVLVLLLSWRVIKC